MSALARVSTVGSLNELDARAGTSVLGVDKLVPVSAPLRPLVGKGLRRGSAVSVSGSMSLAFFLAAEATTSGAWCAVVGVPLAGYEASQHAGVDVSRLVCVPSPGSKWAEVVATLADGCDILMLGPDVLPGPSDVRRLMARLRRRGSVLVAVGEWPGAELRLKVKDVSWEGLGRNHGQLRGCQMEVEVDGKGASSTGRRTQLDIVARAS